jgi:hypothetical protein
MKRIWPWLVIAALAVACVLLLCRKPKVVHAGPVTPTTPAESILVEHWTHDTLVRIVRDRDSINKLNNVIASLTSINDGWEFVATDLGQQLVEVDSAWAARFDSMAGMISVQYQRGVITAVQYQEPKYVRTSKVKTWRNTWTLKTKPGGGVDLQTRRFPVDLGLFAVGGFSTRADTWTPAPYVWAGLSVTRQCVTATVGPMFDGQIKLRGEVRADWRW